MPWSPYEDVKKYSWITTEGDLITPPEFEQSPAGRKVRVVGTRASVNTHDLMPFLLEAVKAKADALGKKLWAGIENRKRERNADLAFIKNPESYTSTTLHWVFRHESLPIEAVLVVALYGRPASTGSYELSVTVEYTRLQSDHPYPGAVTISSSRDANGTHMQAHDYHQRLLEFLRDDPPEWYQQSYFEGRRWRTQRDAARDLLERVRALDDVIELAIPNCVDGKMEWLSLPLYETTATGSIIQELSDFLDVSGSIEAVANAYTDLRRALSQLGVPLPEKSDDDLAAAIHAGDTAAHIALGTAIDSADTGGADHDHYVYFHLTTGTIMVSCSKYDYRNEICSAWDEAQAIASLTGGESALNAFAQRHTEAKRDGIVAKRIGERTLALA